MSDPLPGDGWTGSTGFIHQVVLEEYLSKHPAPEDIEYYLCGPPMMLQAVLKMLYNSSRTVRVPIWVQKILGKIRRGVGEPFYERAVFDMLGITKLKEKA